jgi:hypothetical protein
MVLGVMSGTTSSFPRLCACLYTLPLFIPPSCAEIGWSSRGGGKKWKHEDASEMMFDHLREVNNIDISEEDASFIRALIDGNPRRCAPTEKAFLFEIVANKRNGIDVDKYATFTFESSLEDTHRNPGSTTLHGTLVPSETQSMYLHQGRSFYRHSRSGAMTNSY